LRISVAESGMFKEVRDKNVSRGNILMFFNNARRFRKYILAILIGLPTWFVIGVLVNLSNRFADKLYGENHIVSGRAIMYSYAAIAFGDILVGFICQYFQSRKKALFLYYALCIIAGILFFSPFNNSDSRMYIICAVLGFSTGFWAIFVTMGAEQFGTNLRATAATTIPNMVRGALPLINLLFKNYFQDSLGWTLIKAGIITGIIVMVVTLIAAWFTEETFHKDLNYIEEDPVIVPAP
jgi:putative MFS transporter